LTQFLGRFEFIDEKLENARVIWVGVIEVVEYIRCVIEICIDADDLQTLLDSDSICPIIRRSI
jgi:hypothetical protein